jgi:hypothetical protein
MTTNEGSGVSGALLTAGVVVTGTELDGGAIHADRAGSLG